MVAGVAKAVGLNVPQVKLREQAERFTSSSLLFFRWYTSSLYSCVGLSSSPPPPPPPPPRMAQQPATTPTPATTNQPQGSQWPVTTNAGVGALQALVLASVQAAVTAALQDLSSSVDDRIQAALRQQRQDPPTTGGPPTATLPATMPPASSTPLMTVGTHPSPSSGMVGGHTVPGVATHMPDSASISRLPLLSASGIQSIPFPP